MERPVVSPGQTALLPSPVEIRAGPESHPRVMEKARRYSAYPTGLLLDSQLTQANAAAGDLHDVRHVQPVRRRLKGRRPVRAVVGGER